MEATRSEKTSLSYLILFVFGLGSRALLASTVFSAAKDLALYWHLPGRMNGEFHVIFGIAAIVAAITRREWFHKLPAPAFGLLFFLYVALLFARL